MVLSKPKRLSRPVAIALAILIGIGVWDGTAYAVNAIVSQDLPILAEIAATELASYGELGAILAEAGAIVAQVKEYTTIAKTAWGALHELRQMSFDELKDAALLGVGKAFPELAQIYSDVHDIKDLNYRDYRGYATLQGILWEEMYGPAIDYLHSGHADWEAATAMEEHRIRALGKVQARRTEAERWEEDCKSTSEKGEGACTAAAHRAEIQQALLLTDIHETNLHLLDAERRALTREDRRELDGIYAFDRWTADLENFLVAASGVEGESCSAGACLYEHYGHKMYERVREFRARHPQSYEHRIHRNNNEE